MTPTPDLISVCIHSISFLHLGASDTETHLFSFTTQYQAIFKVSHLVSVIGQGLSLWSKYRPL